MTSIAIYVANFAIALWNVLRAWVGVYRPHGDGYVHSWWYCVDCLANALTGGDPRETISSRAGKALANGRRWACVLCRFLNVFQKDHCIKSVDQGQGGRAVIPDGE